MVRASHPKNARIVASVPGPLTADGSVVPVTITLPVNGTVRGTVTDQSGAVAGIAVTVRSANASFGGFQTATTDATGGYIVAGVPEGSFTATVQDFGRQLFGEKTGTVDTDGQDVTTDISLLNNAVALPAIRLDANGFDYRIEANGQPATGGQCLRLRLQAADGASWLEIVSGGTVAVHRRGGRVDGAGRTRDRFVSGSGRSRRDPEGLVPRAGYFTRYLELLTNPTNGTITVDLRVHSTVGNSSYPMSVVTTSSGDANLDVSDQTTADRWLTIDDDRTSTRSCSNACIGVRVRRRRAARAYRRRRAAGQNQSIALAIQWNAVTVPVATVGIMHFVVQQVSREGPPPRRAPVADTAGGNRWTSPEEVLAVQNFSLPSDSVSMAEPLPSLTGGVAAACSAATDRPSCQYLIKFRSLQPLFGGRPSFRRREWRVQLEGISRTTTSPVPSRRSRSTRAIPAPVEIDQPGDFIGTFSGNLTSVLGTGTASSTCYFYYAPPFAIDADPNSFWLSAGDRVRFEAPCAR